MKNWIKKIDFVILFIMLMPFLFGTFHNFTVFAVAVVLQIIILIFYIKNKKISIQINSALICGIALTVFSTLSIIWAVDRNDATIGTLRYASLLVFTIFIMQCSKERKEKIFEVIPYSGMLMLALSIIIGFIPNLKSMVYTPNGRIMGFFPYANTFALYLLIGIIIITNKKNNKTSIFITLLLLLGILLTGSRTTFILATIYIIYLCFNKQNTQRKYYALSYLALIALAIIYVIIANKLESIERIFNISNSATLLERLLYWKDSIKLIISNPFGLGYMGYSYKVYEVQTGAYFTKYVHNEYLQMILDIGIIPTIIFIAILIKSLISKEHTKLNKIILLIIAIHIILDLDLQSIIIFYIMLMSLEEKIYKEFKIDFSITGIACISVIAIIYSYYGIACFMNFIGKNETANELLSTYTEAKVELMKSADASKIHKYAEEILENNKYEIQAYNANSAYYLFDGSFEKMVENKKKELSLDKYNIELYEEYATMLSDVLQYYTEKNDNKNISKYVNYLFEIEEILENVKNNTSSLAYKIKDNLNLELNEETKNYITQMKKSITY